MVKESANPSPGTRERLITAMHHALRTRGYHGVGVAELLAEAQAPKGVLYHHFPGGKAELAVHAIEGVAAMLVGELDKAFARSTDPVAALAAWMSRAQSVLEKSGFDRGCPLATVALETTAEDEALRQALAQAFAAVRTRLAEGLNQAGLPTTAARTMAALIVSAYEGALLQARVDGRVQVMRDTAAALTQLLQLSLAGMTKPSSLKGT